MFSIVQLYAIFSQIDVKLFYNGRNMQFFFNLAEIKQNFLFDLIE